MSYLNEQKDWKNSFMNSLEYIVPKMFVRPMFTVIKDLQDRGELKKDLVIVEIGTDLALNAKNIQRFVSFKKLFLIDPYFDNYNKYKDGDKRYDIARKRMGNDDRVEFLRGTSEEISKQFNDNSVDCVYIDGNHDYNHVLQDINLWYNKIQKKGIIGGHDFFGSGLGVILAVTDYVNEHSLKEQLDGFGTDWWIRK